MSVASPSGPGLPTWEDRIVPALRKRLEGESAYLSNRLSGTNFPDFQHQQPSHELHEPVVASSSTLPPSSIPRARTKSTPLAGPRSTRSASASSPRPPKQGPSIPSGVRSPSGQSRNARRDPGSSLSPVLADAATLSPPLSFTRRPSLSSSAESPSYIPQPSHTIHRQRSKSSLGPRPSVMRSPSHEGSHTMPSNLPIYTGRASPNRSPHPSPHPSPGKSSIGLDVSTTGRNSLELDSGSRIREGFIKNELPPFRMMPDEAMRIAEKGHDIQDDETYSIGLLTDEEDTYESHTAEDGEGEKRKRAVTMKTDPSKKAARPVGGSAGPSLSGRPSTASNTKISGLPRSTTGLGIGRPSTASRGGQAKGRSATGQPLGSTSTGLGSSRSASMNVLASPPSSSSRLGIAAHLVPPENTYTPPKGANWDDVLLPTVAKRLAVNEPEKPSTRGGPDELAVEWDKDGIPVKWIKRSEMPQHSALGINTSVSNQPSPASSSFVPSFDASPENPLNPTLPLNLRPKKSASSLRQQRSSPGLAPALPTKLDHLDPQALHAHGLRQKRSGENIQLSQFAGPPRTTSAHPTSLDGGSTYATPIAPQDWAAANGRTSPEKMNRKPSLLRKDKSPSVSRQNSASLIRPEYGEKPTGHIPSASYDAGPQAYGNFDASPTKATGRRPPVTPGTSHMIREAAYRDKYSQPSAADTRAKKGKDQVDKGCGCVIM